MSERLRSVFFNDATYYIEKYILSLFMLYYALKNLFFAMRGLEALALWGLSRAKQTRRHISRPRVLPNSQILYPFHIQRF